MAPIPYEQILPPAWRLVKRIMMMLFKNSFRRRRAVEYSPLGKRLLSPKILHFSDWNSITFHAKKPAPFGAGFFNTTKRLP